MVSNLHLADIQQRDTYFARFHWIFRKYPVDGQVVPWNIDFAGILDRVRLAPSLVVVGVQRSAKIESHRWIFCFVVNDKVLS